MITWTECTHVAISSRNTTTCVVTTRRRTSPHTTHDCGRSPRRPTLERFSPTSRAAVVHSEHATAFAHPKVLANKQVHAHKSAYIHAYIRHIQHNRPSHIHMHTNQHNTHTLHFQLHKMSLYGKPEDGRFKTLSDPVTRVAMF